MVIVGLPFEESAPARVGWVTKIGTGATTSTMAAIAIALIWDVEGPTNRISPVRRVLSTVTRIKFTGSSADKLTPGAAVEGGKSTVTVSLADPPKPLLRA